MCSRRRDHSQRARRDHPGCSDNKRHQGTSVPQSLVNVSLENLSEPLRSSSRDSSPTSRNSVSPAVSVSVNHYPQDGYREGGGYSKWLIAIAAIILAVIFVNVMKYINVPGLQYGDDEMRDVQDQVLGVKLTIAKLEMAKQEMEEITSQIHYMLNDIRDLASTFAAKRKKGPCSPDASKETKEFRETDTDVAEISTRYECEDDEELIDFALESEGASIVTTIDTENYREPNAITFLGFTICSFVKGPEVILSPEVIPGNCWAFRGQHATVIIKLARVIQVTGITIDHIPKEYSPYDLDSAPKDFSLYGVNGVLWSEPKARVFYGQFIYKTTATPSQFFPIDKLTYAVNMVELRIHSNNGNSEYTCLYRVRIHGLIEPSLECDVESE